MPPKSAPAKSKSASTKGNSPSTTTKAGSNGQSSNGNGDSDDDHEEDEGNRIPKFNTLAPKALGLYLWYSDCVPPQPYANHEHVWKKVTEKTWKWPELCSKPTSAEFKPLTDELLAGGYLTTKKISTFMVIYAQSHNQLVSKTFKARDTELKNDAVEKAIRSKKDTLAIMTVGKEDTPEKRALVAEEAELKTMMAKIDEELEALSYADPERIEELENVVEESVQAVNNTTEAIFEAHRFYQKKQWFEGSSSQFFKQYQLGEDFEELPAFKRKTPPPPPGKVRGILNGKSVLLKKKK